MRETSLIIREASGAERALPVYWVHTLVIGSGASGLNTAVQLRKAGVDDLVIVTEGLDKGTSINTGSDKQTYYKLSLCGDDVDSPRMLAETYYAGGSMHGDLALVEASVSTRAFMHLVNLGMPFPQDAYGQFVGYKTDHDPRQRATSIGPYTSQEMCRALIREVERRGILVRERRDVLSLLTFDVGEGKRAGGAIALNECNDLEVYAAENVVFATGGPGGLYQTSVYPRVHTGAIGLALLAGAKAQNLPESQYGLASIQFRWNVSGTYMQVIPRFISTESDGHTDEREFLRDYFCGVGEMCDTIFLKGYQWPFDAHKIVDGSSIIDVLVYIETVAKGRRVFLDFRRNPEGFAFEDLGQEGRAYLTQSKALLERPIDRLEAMNPEAVALYGEHGIDLYSEPLEVAVCAQHNNGGLAGNHWWESLNIRHLFPVGEVNGSHGVYRPGGSALNAGQVGGFRIAAFVSNRYSAWSLDAPRLEAAARERCQDLSEWIARCRATARSWRRERQEFQERMTRAGAHVRSIPVLRKAVAEAWAQWRRLEQNGCGYAGPGELREALRNRQLCFAHVVYLESILYAAEQGVGSRGSAMLLGANGTQVHERLGPEWRFLAEDVAFREKVLETCVDDEGGVVNVWVDRRPIPETDAWFETAWAAYRKGQIYDA